MLASKLPYRMMQHIMMNVKPMDFTGWANAARLFHRDNVAVQNVAAIGQEGPGNKRNTGQFKRKGFSSQELAKILNVKLPIDPNAMDTRADRFRSFKPRQSKSRVTTTTDVEKQRSEGRCFTCNKQGHISRNCPDKKTSKTPAKARKTETEESEDETVAEASDNNVNAFIRLGKSLPEDDKLTIIKMAMEAEQKGGDTEEDF
jgi:hypothetical protein